jgi:hypothetical protein
MNRLVITYPMAKVSPSRSMKINTSKGLLLSHNYRILLLILSLGGLEGYMRLDWAGLGYI